MNAAPAPEGAAVRLHVNRRVGTAPAGFLFSAEAAGFDVGDPYFDLRYRWTFGDPGHYTRHDTEDLPWGKYYDVDGTPTLVEDGTVPQGGSVRFLGNDRDVAYGPHAAHVFAAPGEYTVTCEAQARGQAPVRQTMKVLVEDPERHFAGPATICVSAAGDFEGAPPRALRAGSFAEAVRMARQAASANVRILFRRGETHLTPTDRRDREPRRKGSWQRLHWGAFGPGAPPVFGPHNVFLAAAAGGEACISGLDYRGPYRADDPWGASPEGADAIFSAGRAFTTIWDCGLQGGSNLVRIAKRGADVVIGNTFGTDWHNYGIYAGWGVARLGLCGAWFKQNPDAVIGGDEKGETEPPFYQDHAPFRCDAFTGPAAFNLCDLRSVGSWAGYYQPCLRLGRSGTEVEEAVMDRIRGENGGMLGTGNNGSEAWPRRYLWDKIYLVLMPEGSRVFNPTVSGLHYRNVIVVIPDVPSFAGNTTKWITRGPPSNEAVDTPQVAEMGVTLMNSTLVDLRPTHPMEFDTAQMRADYGFVRIANNVVYTPRKDDPTATHDAPLDLGVMWQVTNRGMRYREDPFAAVFAPAEDAAAYYRPLPASPAFADAAGEAVAVDDFFGRIRGAATSRGAIDAVP